MSKFSGAFAARIVKWRQPMKLLSLKSAFFKRILISSNLSWSLFSAAHPSPHFTTPSWHKFSDLNWDYTKFSRQAWPSVKVSIRLKVIVMDQIEVNVKIMADVKVQVQFIVEVKFKDRVIVKIKVMVQIKATAKVKE